jgi:hypothetical protein
VPKSIKVLDDADEVVKHVDKMKSITAAEKQLWISLFAKLDHIEANTRKIKRRMPSEDQQQQS